LYIQKCSEEQQNTSTSPSTKSKKLILLSPSMKKPLKFSASFIIQMFQKQKGRCIYCNHSLIVGDKYRKPTIEHITPKSQGWTDSQDNLCLACFKCNMYRGNIDLDLFMDGYRCWCEHSGNDSNSITLPRKFRSPKRWYHGNLIKW
jgi:hypothetical protein